MKPADFQLNERLDADTWPLMRSTTGEVRLMRNAGVGWLILVPYTEMTELCDLEPALYQAVQQEVVELSQAVRQVWSTDKLNVAAIGNVVSQLHIHIISRRTDDYCWPAPVWGTQAPSTYNESDVLALAQRFLEILPDHYHLAL